MANRTNKEVMDDINGSATRPQRWVPCEHHPDKGYYIDDDDVGGADLYQRNKRIDEIEKYLRS